LFLVIFTLFKLVARFHLFRLLLTLCYGAILAFRQFVSLRQEVTTNHKNSSNLGSVWRSERVFFVNYRVFFKMRVNILLAKYN